MGPYPFLPVMTVEGYQDSDESGDGESSSSESSDPTTAPEPNEPADDGVSEDCSEAQQDFVNMRPGAEDIDSDCQANDVEDTIKLVTIAGYTVKYADALACVTASTAVGAMGAAGVILPEPVTTSAGGTLAASAVTGGVCSILDKFVF